MRLRLSAMFLGMGLAMPINAHASIPPFESEPRMTMPVAPPAIPQDEPEMEIPDIPEGAKIIFPKYPFTAFLKRVFDPDRMRGFAGMTVVDVDVDQFYPTDVTFAELTPAEQAPLARAFKAYLDKKFPNVTKRMDDGIKAGLIDADVYGTFLGIFEMRSGMAFAFGDDRQQFCFVEIPQRVKDNPTAYDILNVVINLHQCSPVYPHIPLFGEELFKPKAVLDAIYAARITTGMSEKPVSDYIAHALLNDTVAGPKLLLTYYMRLVGIDDPSARLERVKSLEARMLAAMNRLGKVEKGMEQIKEALRMGRGQKGVEAFFAAAWLKNIDPEIMKRFKFKNDRELSDFVHLLDAVPLPERRPAPPVAPRR